MDRDLHEPQPFDPAQSVAPHLPPDVSGEPGVVLLVAASAAREHEWAERAAVSLASGWAEHGRRILLADFALARPGLHRALEAENGEGVSDVFLFGSSVQRVACPVRDGRFLFVPAGTATARPDVVATSDRWHSIVEGCARARAMLVVFLPSDLPGGEALLERANHVVLLTESTDMGAALSPAVAEGLGERLRAVLVPPDGVEGTFEPAEEAAPELAEEALTVADAEEPFELPEPAPPEVEARDEPDAAASDVAGPRESLEPAQEEEPFGALELEDRTSDPGDRSASADDLDPFPDLGPTPEALASGGLETDVQEGVEPAPEFDLSGFDRTLEDQHEEAGAPARPSDAGNAAEEPLVFTLGPDLADTAVPEAEPLPTAPPMPAAASNGERELPRWRLPSLDEESRAPGGAVSPPPFGTRADTLRPPPLTQARVPSRTAPRPRESHTRVLLLLLLLVLVAAAAAAWYGLVEIPWLSPWLRTLAAEPGPTVPKGFAVARIVSRGSLSA